MRHLFSSAFRVEEMRYQTVNGRAVLDWAVVPGLEYVKGRLDLNFIRPGKDIAPAPVAGKAPDRIGILFTDWDAGLKAGQRIIMIPNDQMEMPVQGTFEIKVIPDVAVGFSSAHHLEIQVLETVQDLEGVWPDVAEDEREDLED
jgi:hypothetical protein